MADNYLEKKYEALQQGKTVYRRNGPSLDMLLRACAQDKQPSDSSYIVKMAQLEAMVRSADSLGLAFCPKCEECTDGKGRIEVSSSQEQDIALLGEYLLALRLKAAELGLSSRILSAGAEQKTTSAVAVVEVFK